MASSVVAAQTGLDEALAARAATAARAEEDAIRRAAKFRGEVIEFVDATGVSVAIEGGSPSFARIVGDVGQVEVGDTVEASKLGGVWQVTAVLTKHPTPVVTAAGTQQEVTVPDTPGKVSPIAANSQLTNATSLKGPWSDDRGTVSLAFSALNTRLGNLDTNIDRILTAFTAFRTPITRSASNAAAAASAVGGVVTAAATSGVVSKVARYSLPAMPPITGTTWQESRGSVQAVLEHRITALTQLRATLANVCTYLNTTAPSALPAVPAHGVSTMWWGSGAPGTIQGVDDWASTVISNLRTRINSVRTLVGLPAFAWPVGLVFAWPSAGTSEAAMPGLRSSADAYRQMLSALGSAMAEITNRVNTSAAL